MLEEHDIQRRKIEIPPGHRLRGYALTSAWCKSRAHPVAVRIAITLLRDLGSIQAVKGRWAGRSAGGFGVIPWLEVPEVLRSLNRNKNKIQNEAVSENGDSEIDIASAIDPAWYALTLRFKAALVPPGPFMRESFVADLQAEGLSGYGYPEIDGPAAQRAVVY
jgi:hypothetical protein